jgi:hypothetical protein
VSHPNGRAHTGGIGKGWKPKFESVWCAHCREANTVTLKGQRSIWKGDEEVVKRSGYDESLWDVIYLCTEAMLGISLYSFLYLKLVKTPCLSHYCICILFNKTRAKGRTGCASKWVGWGEEGRGGGQRGEMAQTMYVHMNKWIKKNNKKLEGIEW